MSQTALPSDPYDVRDDARLLVWAADPRRVIEIGAKYRANPATCYCFVGGCADCWPGSQARCWQRRTATTFVYRVRELLHIDREHGTGRRFLVTLVRPDKWQVIAFTMGTSHSRDIPRAQWHTITGIVSEAQLGERVE